MLHPRCHFFVRMLPAIVLPALLAFGCSSGPSGAVDLGSAPGQPGVSPPGATDPAQTFREVTIYYISGNEGALKLVPETHSVPYTPRVATSALEELIHGTPHQAGHSTPFPRTSNILAVTISGGVATVDWSQEVLGATVPADEEALGIQSVVWTLTEFPSIDSVRFTVEGRDRGQVASGRLIENWWGHVGLGAQALDPGCCSAAPAGGCLTVVMKAATLIRDGGVLLNCYARMTGLRHCRHSMGRVQHCQSLSGQGPRTVESIMGTNLHASTGWVTALVLTLVAAGCSATSHPLGTAPRPASPPTSAVQADQGPPTPTGVPPGLVTDPAAFAGQGRLVFSYQGGTYLIDGQRRTLEALPGGSVLSPDGQWVAWQVPDESGSQLWVRPLGNGGPAQLTGLTPGTFAWSPDSKMLAVAFVGSVTVGGPGMQVHTLMSLQATEDVSTIAWSPTSARVAVASAHKLWVGGPGSDTEQVAQAPEGLDLAGWSPDGQTLAYVLTLPSKDPPISSTELDTVPAGGGAPVRRYVSEEARILFAGWWPDSGGIVFWDDPMGSASLLADGVGLLSLSLAGGAPRPLGTALSYPDWVSWAGGDQIVFVVARGRESWTSKSLEACDAAKATCRAIPQPAGKVSVDPAWSAASNQVTFVRADELRGADGTDSETGGPAWVATRALWIASPDGSGQRELTAAGRGVFGPSWSRDGRHLLYLRDGALWLMDTISGTAARIVTLKLDPTAYFYGHINWQEQATWWKG